MVCVVFVFPLRPSKKGKNETEKIPNFGIFQSNLGQFSVNVSGPTITTQNRVKDEKVY